MRHRAKKHNFAKIFFHPIFISVIGFFILLYITMPIIRNAQKQKKINNEIKELENEIARLDGNNSDLKKMINYLNSDQFVLEQARLNLNYKKDSEEVLVVKGMETKEEVGSGQLFNINEKKQERNILKDSNIYKWWIFFVKI
jgi:cell division protein FtsB